MMEEIKDYPPYLDYPKPRRKQTNADRIRAMSDEELAKQLVVTLTGGPITMYLALNNGTSYLSKKFATEKVLEWLQQPAEVPEYA